MRKKIIVILLAAVMLNGSTEVHQLFKLPFLVRHYLHHQKENISLSFIAFLKIHYTDKENQNDNDDKEDNELPFKSVGNISHIDIPVIGSMVTSTGRYLQGKNSTYYPEGIPNQRAFSIFHPPRIA